MPGVSYNFSEILKAIRVIIRAIDVHSKNLGATAGITVPQLIMLKEIQQYDTITTTKLSDKVSLSQSTVTIIIDKLVAKNLVNRIRDHNDKRQWHLELSAEGRRISSELHSVLPEGFMEVFPDLPSWQQSQILGTLQHVAEMMDK